MNYSTFARFGAVTLVIGTLAYPAVAQMNSNSMGGMDHSMPMDADSASAKYMAAMKTMDENMGAMKMTGKPGVDYAMMMIPHHQSAIEMAKAYLASGEDDPVLTKLSNDVVSSQQTEISKLKDWLAKNGQQ